MLPVTICTLPVLDIVPMQIAGGQRYRPPSVDVNAPDLFIPLMGLWSYALLSCVVLAFKQAFKPEMMSSTVCGTQAAHKQLLIKHVWEVCSIACRTSA